MVTHLEPDILECQVKWTIASITTSKASGDEGIPYELFKILKDDAVKVWHSMCSKFGKLISGHRTGKGQFSFPFQRRAMLKNVQTTVQLLSFHMLTKWLKILQSREDSRHPERQSKCKSRNYKTPRGKHRQNTLWHKSQQNLLWPTSQRSGNKKQK